jgi:hypothetical protein
VLVETKDIVAVLALIVSLIALFWQPVKHRLDGARVRIHLLPGLWYPLNGTLSQATTWDGLAEWTAEEQGWTVEVAILVIENPGRIGLTIAKPSLDFGRTKRWKPGRASVALRPVEAPGAFTETVTRLQPFDRVTFVFDFWPHLRQQKGMPEYPFDVRGSVRVAGKRWPSLSPWRKRWAVKAGQVTFFETAPEAETVAYRAIRRHAQTFSEDCILICCAEAAHEIRRAFPLSGPPPTKDEIRAILDRYHPAELDQGIDIRKGIGREAHGLISLYAAEDLAPHYPASMQPDERARAAQA